jgi:hypothetical protein
MNAPSPIPSTTPATITGRLVFPGHGSWKELRCQTCRLAAPRGDKNGRS